MSKEIRIETAYGTLTLISYGQGTGDAELMATPTARVGIKLTQPQVEDVVSTLSVNVQRRISGIMYLWGASTIVTPTVDNRPTYNTNRTRKPRRRPGIMDGVVDFTAPGVGDFDGDTIENVDVSMLENDINPGFEDDTLDSAWIGDHDSLWGNGN